MQTINIGKYHSSLGNTAAGGAVSQKEGKRPSGKHLKTAYGKCYCWHHAEGPTKKITRKLYKKRHNPSTSFFAETAMDSGWMERECEGLRG